jgi:hypothetical protein
MREYRYKVFKIVTSLSLAADILSNPSSNTHLCFSPRKEEAFFENRAE